MFARVPGPRSFIPCLGGISMVFGFLRRKQPDTAEHLYAAATALSRAAWLYGPDGVPDTLEGRLELLMLHVGLVVDRLTSCGGEGRKVAQRLSERFFGEMEVVLREHGISDKSLMRRMGHVAKSFYGRLTAYTAVLPAGELAPLAAVLNRNVWDGAGSDVAVDRLAAHIRQLHAALAAAPLATILTGDVLSAALVDPTSSPPDFRNSNLS
jgi:cytochrome b pre-mRNA-processing protein 3